MNSVLPIEGSALKIRRGDRTVLDVPSVSVGGASCTAIIGPNGAGKSLLLRTLGGLLMPDSGSVSWGGQSAPSPKQSGSVGMRDRRLAVESLNAEAEAGPSP